MLMFCPRLIIPTTGHFSSCNHRTAFILMMWSYYLFVPRFFKTNDLDMMNFVKENFSFPAVLISDPGDKPVYAVFL